jgi:hypothetical protein
MKRNNNKLVIIGWICGFFIVFSLFYLFYKMQSSTREGFENNEYLLTLTEHYKERIFPYRYFQDEKENMLPIVAVTGFFRDERAKNLFQEYLFNGVKLFGITAYKSFPRAIKDGTADDYTAITDFNYTSHISDWLCCFKNPDEYGFDDQNRIIDMSESDFYDADFSGEVVPKKYDFIYVCFDDDDKHCPPDGWNAVNRNFDLAKKCLPILINDYKLKGMIVGRNNCGLEELYGDRLELSKFLPYHEFQSKLRESKMLFIPNIADASPRTVAEALIKDIPVLMNRNIMCGSKYITHETGELFTDETDIRPALDSLLGRMSQISPRQWWSENYSVEKSGKKLRDFLFERYPEELKDVKRVLFYV